MRQIAIIDTLLAEFCDETRSYVVEDGHLSYILEHISHILSLSK